ncbi:reverse transcriptase domain-containing protein [Tanacetum coccineum]
MKSNFPSLSELAAKVRNIDGMMLGSDGKPLKPRRNPQVVQPSNIVHTRNTKNEGFASTGLTGSTATQNTTTTPTCESSEITNGTTPISVMCNVARLLLGQTGSDRERLEAKHVDFDYLETLVSHYKAERSSNPIGGYEDEGIRRFEDYHGDGNMDGSMAAKEKGRVEHFWITLEKEEEGKHKQPHTHCQGSFETSDDLKSKKIEESRKEQEIFGISTLGRNCWTANLRKHEDNVPKDADYDVWLPLITVHEVNDRIKNSDYGYFIRKKLAFPVVKCQKGSEGGSGIKEKHVLMADKPIEVTRHGNVALGSNSATRTPSVLNASLESFPTISEAHGNYSPASANEENMSDADTKVGPTPSGNTLGLSSYANVTSVPSRKALNFCTLFTPMDNGIDVVVLVESSRDISEQLLNTAYGFFRKAGGLSRYVGNVPVWVKLYGVPVTVFSKDGLSAIATKLGTSLMLDSYTSDMCIQSWGRSSYVRALIEVRDDMELKDNIVVAMAKLNECPKNLDSYVVKNMKKPSQATRGVLVGPNVGFKPVKQVYRQVSKKNNINTSGNKKKDAEPTIEVSNSNPFDVLNLVENIINFGTNGKATLIDDEGKLLAKVDSLDDHDSEDEVASVENDMTNFLASNKGGYGTNGDVGLNLILCT